MSFKDDDLCFAATRSPGYLIRRAAQLVVPHAEAVFKDQELTLSQWIALKFMYQGVADTSVSLSHLLGHNSGATTRLIDQLEERGLLTRTRRTDDRRVVNIELTKAGIAGVQKMTPKMSALWKSLLADFTDGETAMLISLLARLVDRLERTETG